MQLVDVVQAGPPSTQPRLPALLHRRSAGAYSVYGSLEEVQEETGAAAASSVESGQQQERDDGAQGRDGLVSFAAVSEAHPSAASTALPDLRTPTLTGVASSSFGGEDQAPTATRTGMGVAVVVAGLALFAASAQERATSSRRRDYEEMIDMEDEAL